MGRAAGALALLALAGCGGAHPPATVSTMPVADGIPLGTLQRQSLGEGECGLFLWKAAPSGRLVLMAKSGPPPFARIILDGRQIDLPRLGGGDLAADPNARYGDGRLTVSLDLTLERRAGLSDGAIVRAGSLRIDRTEGDGFTLPVSGLLACG